VERIDDSVRRLLALKLKKGIIGPQKPFNAENILKIISSKRTAALKKKITEKAVTLVKNSSSTLPFKPINEQKIVYFAPSQKGVESVREALNNVVQRLKINDTLVTGFNYQYLNLLTLEQKKAIDESNCIILFTRTVRAEDLDPKCSYIASFTAELVTYADSTDKKMVAIAIRNPYDIQFMPEVRAYIAAYSDWNGGGVEASLKTVFGMINPEGRLPVSIPDNNGTVLYPCGFGMSYN
jgi:beta-N-acetylhexosaminidase